jgi:nucleoid-associated protein YgaU
MHPEYNPANPGEILNTAPRLEAPVSVDGRIGSQLSQPTDVQAARNYFQNAGGQTQLPDFSLDTGFGTGAESALTQPTGTGVESALMQPTGVESALTQPAMTGIEQGLMPGLEQGLAGAIPPGGEPISPLVQMILKMPGLTGLVGDFFSALMAFFFPADGGLMALLDPTVWAAAAQNAFTTLATVVMHDFPLTLTTMGTNNPFQTMLQNGLMDSTKAASSVGSPVTLSLEHQPFTAQTFNVGGNVGPGNSMYEMSSMDGSRFVDGNSVNVDWSSNKFLAMENQGSFGPTIGGSQVPTAQMQTPNGQVAPQQWQQQSAPSGSDGGMQQSGDAGQYQQTGADAGDGRGSLMNSDGTAGSGTEIANTPEVQPHHIVERGDNLWNIAKQNLGSGQRWTEIYDLNKDVIGSNPDLIFSGTDLKLPGGADSIASNPSSYMVKPGDNLWNIARDHMGGGQNWHSIYDQNVGTIGANPDLIHPGQNLAIPDGGSHMQVAHSAPAVHHAPPAHHPSSANTHTAHTAHHGSSSAHHTAHAKPAHDATTHSTTAHNPGPAQSDIATKAQESAASQAASAGAKTSNLGKTVAATDNESISQGLEAVARSL